MGAIPKRVVITGNTKYDQTYAEVSEEERAKLRREFRFEGKGPIIVAGSTHGGEEEIVVRTFGKVLENIRMPAFFWRSAKLPVPPRCGS